MRSCGLYLLRPACTVITCTAAFKRENITLRTPCAVTPFFKLRCCVHIRTAFYSQLLKILQLMASLSTGGRSLCLASVVFRFRGRGRCYGYGFVLRLQLGLASRAVSVIYMKLVIYALCDFRRRPSVDNRRHFTSKRSSTFCQSQQ